ncbi:hypothetical protein ACLB2K_035572 [Fragaria x ananassa]
MATTALLIEASPLKLKQQGTLLRTFRLLPSKPFKFSSQRCFAPSLKPPPHRYSLSRCLDVCKDKRAAAASTDFSRLWGECLKALRKPATAAVLLGLLVMHNPNLPALAAPVVGRVGARWTSNITTRSYYLWEEFHEPIWDLGPIFLYCLGLFFLSLLPFPDLVLSVLVFSWTMVVLNCRLICHTSVVKLQLQLKLSNTVQMDLNRIAETAEPKTFEGLRYVLRDTAIALLRQPDYCISRCTYVIIPKFTRAAALQCFDTLVVRERAGCDG